MKLQSTSMRISNRFDLSEPSMGFIYDCICLNQLPLNNNSESGLFYLMIYYELNLTLNGTTKTKNALIRDGVSESKIISVGEVETDSIEELFDDEDQKKFSLKDTNKSKTIISRNFHDQVIEKKLKITLSNPIFTLVENSSYVPVKPLCLRASKSSMQSFKLSSTYAESSFSIVSKVGITILESKIKKAFRICEKIPGYFL